MTRPDKHDFDTLTDNSWSVHGGNHADETTGAIRTPIVMANSYALPEDPTTIEDPGYQGLVYTRESVAQLGRFPEHREAKGQVARWYDGYRIVVSDVRATYGDGRLPAPSGASLRADETPDQDAGRAAVSGDL